VSTRTIFFGGAAAAAKWDTNGSKPPITVERPRLLPQRKPKPAPPAPEIKLAELTLEHLWHARPCFICEATCWCEHREIELDRARLEALKERCV
jgi:hypothetical protein